MMKVTDYICQKLIEYDVDTVFGYSGGSIADLIDSICENNGLSFVETYNEQGAAFAANAYAQVTNNIGVAISSSGPGALNLISGVANAYYDSVPCLFITGNVHSLYTKGNESIRQSAFQEMDVTPIFSSITKYCTYVNDECNIKYELDKAVYLATHGRKGPSVIDIPYDIQRKNIDPCSLPEFIIPQNIYSQGSLDYECRAVFDLLKKSLAPLVLIGGGCAGYEDDLYSFFNMCNIPAICSLRGLDCINNSYHAFMGMVGEYGSYTAKVAAYNCDLLIVLGSRLDDRQIGYDISEFCPHAKIVQIDIDNNEIGRKVKDGILIHSDVKDFLQYFSKHCSPSAFTFNNWVKALNDCKKKKDYLIPTDMCYIANRTIQHILELSPKESIYTIDVGQNQMISAQILSKRTSGKVLSSCGLGAMGYSLPASIGAFFASSNTRIISISGDGGLQMNLQELETIRREKLPIVVVVINNQSLGLIKQLQDKLFNSRYHASEWGYSNCNFSKLAQAYDMEYISISNSIDITKTNHIFDRNMPTVVEIISPITTPYPSPNDKSYKDELIAF